MAEKMLTNAGSVVSIEVLVAARFCGFTHRPLVAVVNCTGSDKHINSTIMQFGAALPAIRTWRLLGVEM